jgi:hypothetical protein
MEMKQLRVGGGGEPAAQVILRLIAAVEQPDQLVHQLVFGAEGFVDDCEG